MKDDQLLAFKHEGFWRPMDTLKDKEVLEDLVEQGRMPWRINGAAATVKTAVDRKAG
jgi:glucose-1-phosphate cytidylyltransferase